MDDPPGRLTGDGVLGSLMLAFEGPEVPAAIADRLATAPAAGVTLFRFANVQSPAQVRRLTDALQAAAARRVSADDRSQPLIMAADQEGGQFLALGDATTPFAGNMALGATGDAALAERVARATGRELRALGVNVAYAPVCDLATNPHNPAIGIRSFGDDPGLVAPLVAASVRGLQREGVAAGLKHFPGIGQIAEDTHHTIAAIGADRERLQDVELVPFRAGIAAGARIVMSGHAALPALTGDPDLPATLAPEVMTGLLRDELGFEGVSITDALDMRALAQGPTQVLEAMAALHAGADLLLTAPDADAREHIEAGLRHAERRGLLDRRQATSRAGRVEELRTWIAAHGEPPDLDVVGSEEHLALARELAARAVTLVRNDARLLPLSLAAGDRIAAIMPLPTDQTPADTSSTVDPGLAQAFRERNPEVDEFIVAHAPGETEIAAVREAVREHALIVLGTTAAFVEPGQAALANALIDLGRPLVTVALRTPFDLAAYPRSQTHISTYGILRPSLDALAAAVFGDAGFPGRLPAAVPGLYPTGHGIVR